MRICTVVGARPQFIKASVVSRALAAEGIEEDLVHTGQHYDDEMSKIFFDELGLSAPRVNLGVGSGSHAIQTGRIMVALEEFLGNVARYDAVLVYGDTNSTLAAALVGAKLHVPVVHVEAGLRSFNARMPEEVNRIIADRLSQLLFCPSDTAVRNLEAEGIRDGVFNTGDVMFDALLKFKPRANMAYPLQSIIPFDRGAYYLATIHRQENTDDPSRLTRLNEALAHLEMPVVWPVHPRTRKRMREYGIMLSPNVRQLEPIGYLGMLVLLDNAAAVLTDSGGMQKEAFWMQKPCVTLRPETEWTETVECGWNALADLSLSAIRAGLSVSPPPGRIAPYGTGHASSAVVRELVSWHAGAAPKP